MLIFRNRAYLFNPEKTPVIRGLALMGVVPEQLFACPTVGSIYSIHTDGYLRKRQGLQARV